MAARAIVNPKLNNVTLPSVSEFREVSGYRGGSVTLADGSLFFEVVNPNEKRVWQLQWRGLTDDERSLIKTTVAVLKTASAAFTSPDGFTAVVTRSPRAEGMVWQQRISAGRFLWETSLELWEV